MPTRRRESALSPQDPLEDASPEATTLTDAAVAALRCPSGRKDVLVFDTQMPGFGVRVTKGGTKTFLFQYRMGSKVRRMAIGAWGLNKAKDGGLTSKRARDLAARHRGAVLEGRDPWGERKAAQAEILAAEADARRQREEATFTVEALLTNWLAAQATACRPAYLRDVKSRVRHNLAPLLGKPAGEVTKVDAVRQIDRIAAERTVITARRTLAYARAIYGWALKRGEVAANPFQSVPAPGKEVEREHVLSDAEVGAIWRAAGDEGAPYGPLVRLLMLTLARREEVAAMTWGEVAEDVSTWTQPGERTKNGKAHIVHLSAPARDLLRALHPKGSRPAADALVFQRSLGGRLTAFSATKVRLDDASGVTGWRFHDFRRTGVTVLARLGTPPHVADRLLNHLTGVIRGVAAVYQRHDFAEERKAALDLWGRHVLRCASGKDAEQTNVVVLRESVGRGTAAR